ncbi:gp436 family protein [Grimontia hollisae]|uniref:gp436 family protein n=1 Tax=Grimontia hollisae TaxID=673 RepID=UPI001C68837B|nr:phage protein Gp36 family protein [Grimontia hollisae]
MMYCTPADMESRFGAHELTQLTGGTTAPEEAKLNQAIGDATAKIDSYLSGRYQLPLASRPDVLVQICADIARWSLYDDQLPEEHQAARRYKEAVRYLEQVGKGVLSLQLPDNTSPASNNTAMIQSAGSVFARDSSKGFI